MKDAALRQLKKSEEDPESYPTVRKHENFLQSDQRKLRRNSSRAIRALPRYQLSRSHLPKPITSAPVKARQTRQAKEADQTQPKEDGRTAFGAYFSSQKQTVEDESKPPAYGEEDPKPLHQVAPHVGNNFNRGRLIRRLR
uniref:Uncharacterized protein MJ0066 n=1 Tax=Anthurium amnicola TaxID=1678845 RepID=A0A1D1YZN8_9ARAE